MGWNMRAMFFGASSFNQPLGDWWVQQVRTMQAMFHGAESMVEPNVLYSAFKWFTPTRGRLADQWWADKEAMEKDKERPRWQLGDPSPVAELSDERFTGVVVACEVREVELSDPVVRRFYSETQGDTRRRFSPSATGLATQSGRQDLKRYTHITASSAPTSRARRDQIRPMRLLSAPRWYSWACSWLMTNTSRASK